MMCRSTPANIVFDDVVGNVDADFERRCVRTRPSARQRVVIDNVDDLQQLLRFGLFQVGSVVNVATVTDYQAASSQGEHAATVRSWRQPGPGA